MSETEREDAVADLMGDVWRSPCASRGRGEAGPARVSARRPRARSPTGSDFRGLQERAAVEELGQRSGSRGRSRPAERGEQSENRLRFCESDVGDLGAKAPVPAEGGTLEAWGIGIAKETREFERVLWLSPSNCRPLSSGEGRAHRRPPPRIEREVRPRSAWG